MSKMPASTDRPTHSASPREYERPTLIHYGPLSELTKGGRGSQAEGASHLLTKHPG